MSVQVQENSMEQISERGKRMPGVRKEIYVSGIRIEVRKKKIKNLYLSVKPPDGRVVISAPYGVSDQMMEAFVREKMEWIARQKKRMEQRPPVEEKHYRSGESLYIWGKKYTLVLHEEERKNAFVLCGDNALLYMRRGSTKEQREAYIREQYRAMLKAEAARLVPGDAPRYGKPERDYIAIPGIRNI